MIQKRFLRSYLKVWAGEPFRHLHIWMSATIADGSMSDGAVWKLYLPLQLEHCSQKGLHPELRRPSPKVLLDQTPLQSERPGAMGGGTITICAVGCLQPGCQAGDTTAGDTANIII